MSQQEQQQNTGNKKAQSDDGWDSLPGWCQGAADPYVVHSKDPRRNNRRD